MIPRSSRVRDNECPERLAVHPHHSGGGAATDGVGVHPAALRGG